MSEKIEQHDDHCWLTADGKAWKIVGIIWPLIFMARGYYPNIETTIIDMSQFRSKEYCDKATQMLEVANDMGNP